jgi:hypothetical protein
MWNWNNGDEYPYVTGISTVSFDVSVSQVLWPLHLIQNYKLSLSHMLSDIFHTNSLTVLIHWLWHTADNSALMIMELGSQRVWPVDKGFLLLLGTWSHLRQVQGSVLAHLSISCITPTCVSRLITRWYHSHFIMKCSVFNEGRRLYVPQVYIQCSNTLKFYNLFSCEQIIICYQLPL